jgi:hypothetical protein
MDRGPRRNVSATVVYNSHFIMVEQPQEHPKLCKYWNQSALFCVTVEF